MPAFRRGIAAESWDLMMGDPDSNFPFQKKEPISTRIYVLVDLVIHFEVTYLGVVITNQHSGCADLSSLKGNVVAS
jgi:hypothetical protein